MSASLTVNLPSIPPTIAGRECGPTRHIPTRIDWRLMRTNPQLLFPSHDHPSAPLGAPARTTPMALRIVSLYTTRQLPWAERRLVAPTPSRAQPRSPPTAPALPRRYIVQLGEVRTRPPSRTEELIYDRPTAPTRRPRTMSLVIHRKRIPTPTAFQINLVVGDRCPQQSHMEVLPLGRQARPH